MFCRYTFRQDELALADGRVLKLRRCAEGTACRGHGWIADDHLTLEVTTDVADAGVAFLHFSVSYAKRRAPSAADVRLVRDALRAARAGRMVDEPVVYIRNNVVQCLEITPIIEAIYGRRLPMGARQFDIAA